MKHTIWQNINLDIDDWKEDYMECCSISEDDYDESEALDWMYDTNNMYLDDERENLNRRLDGRILVLGDIGLWNGRVRGYKIIESRNLKDILDSDCDYVEWYFDGNNVKSTQHHHDGTNYLEYRVIRPNKNIDRLLGDIYNGKEITRKRLNYYTRSLKKEMKEIYWW